MKGRCAICIKCDLKLFLLQSAQIFCHQNEISEEDLVLALIEMTEELTSGEDWASEDDLDDILVQHPTIQ